ncbi:enoyl-CoA hydratase/isomerase family protein [Dactylosporangium sp. NPDC005572]|uniref:enoyl-CoA hydratase/isomerase family protein n=1 Tax=Dactylosporangium sp. NPDC005572 TaxID=3156889 RepID=UPI0033B65D1B
MSDSTEDYLPQVRVEGLGPVRRIVLDRPDRHNAQTPRMWAELAAAGRMLSADPEVCCVVLVGNGASFSSGIDLEEIRRPDGFIRRLAAHPPGDPDPMLAAIAVAQESVRWIPRAPFLVVAAITGAALGAGCQLALACDVRIVADDARFALAEVRHGLLPDLGATAWLPRLVGRERALDLMLTGREFTGIEAVTLGLALRAVPAPDVLSTAQEYAEAVGRLPRAIPAYLKTAVDAAGLERSLAAAAEGQAACIRANSALRDG